MKVYIVTAGEYSSYHIDAVFTDEKIANQYANLDSDREVEEYETDIESVIPDPNKLIYHVSYDFETDEIKTLCLTAGHNKSDDFVFDCQTTFVFYVSPSKTLDDSIKMFGMNSDWLHKIAVDRFYMYCDAHETSRQELLQKHVDRNKKLSETFVMYKTSGDSLFNPYFYADAKCNAIMKDLIANGIELPTGKELNDLYHELVKKTVEENVKVDEHDEQ